MFLALVEVLQALPLALAKAVSVIKEHERRAR